MPLNGLAADRFEKSRGYRRAQRIQAALMVSFPLTVAAGTLVGYLVGKLWVLWSLLIIAGLQVSGFLFAEFWKTFVFGREVLREARRLRSKNPGEP